MPEPPADALTTPALDLARLGWDDTWAEVWNELVPASRVRPARVGRVDRGRCEVALGIGDDDELLTTLAIPQIGAGHAVVDQPATGDWVALDRREDGDVITAVLPRRTQIVRGSAGARSDGQVLATNVDTVLIAVPLEREVNLNQLERFVTVAWESGGMPLVVLTKSDLVDDPDEAIRTATEGAPGAQVLAVSSETGEGLDILMASLGPTVALIGTSGAGKSTLVNALTGREHMATQATRSDGKGRHTTTTRELIPRAEGGILIDTPGLRGIGVHDASDGVAQTFSDIEALAEDCRFGDCGHDSEPGCAVTAAIEDGSLTERRLGSYRKQLREIEFAARRNDPAAQAAARKRWAKQTAGGKVGAALKRGQLPH